MVVGSRGHDRHVIARDGERVAISGTQRLPIESLMVRCVVRRDGDPAIPVEAVHRKNTR